MSEMSREKALEVLNVLRFGTFEEIINTREIVNDALDVAIEGLKEQRPHGEWKPDGTCSECGVYSSLNKDATYFCPNYGASMSANDRQVTGKLNSEIEKSKSEIVPDYRDGWRLKEGDSDA